MLAGAPVARDAERLARAPTPGGVQGGVMNTDDSEYWANFQTCPDGFCACWSCNSDCRAPNCENPLYVRPEADADD
jgi:hypothetical protein